MHKRMPSIILSCRAPRKLGFASFASGALIVVSGPSFSQELKAEILAD
jgi:hypothetical protein